MRMATLKKKVQQALRKAKNVGRHEEAVNIDGCSIVLQSLPAASFDAVLQECVDLDGSEYAHSYQIGHVCRSIVEIESVDLRDIQFIEDDVPVGAFLVNAVVASEAKAQKAREMLKELGIDLTVAPPEEGDSRTVLVERHEWVRQRVSTWSQEAVAVAFRKFTDVVMAGDAKAKEGIQFRTADESAEDKFRRLLAEAKEIEGALAPDLTQKILEEVGYLQKTSAEELEEVAKRAREFSKEQTTKEEEKSSPSASPPESPDNTSDEDVSVLMRNRTRLNQQAMNVPVPSQEVPQAQPARVPPQIVNATNLSPKAKEIAALEGGVDPSLLEHLERGTPLPNRNEIAELSKPTPGINQEALGSILEKPPVVGLNPKFHRRPQ
jgi:hypothetical protein